jgi:hypothetical protein
MIFIRTKMKTKLIIIVSILSFLLDSCNRKESDGEDPIISGNVTYFSDCKNHSSIKNNLSGLDTVMCMLWEYHSSTKMLELKHLNTYFNCAPGEISADIYEINDTIHITESEEQNPANCLCPYDINMELTDVTQKEYTVEMILPYPYAWGLTNPIYFEMDLITFPTGQYCW